jgi:hypothetical protein
VASSHDKIAARCRFHKNKDPAYEFVLNWLSSGGGDGCPGQKQ